MGSLYYFARENGEVVQIGFDNDEEFYNFMIQTHNEGEKIADLTHAQLIELDKAEAIKLLATFYYWLEYGPIAGKPKSTEVVAYEKSKNGLEIWKANPEDFIEGFSICNNHVVIGIGVDEGKATLKEIDLTSRREIELRLYEPVDSDDETYNAIVSMAFSRKEAQFIVDKFIYEIGKNLAFEYTEDADEDDEGDDQTNN